MLHRRRRLAAKFLAIGLLTATLFTVDSLTSPSPAEARCTGVNNPVYSWFSYGGGVAVSETPEAGACNNNNVYVGYLKDARADGYCVSVEFKDGNQTWLPAESLGGATMLCGYGATMKFSWHDVNGNHQAYQRFCLREASYPYYFVACGWGTVVWENGYALNSGY